MGKQYERYTPEFRQRVAEAYLNREDDVSARAVAERWKVGGGHKLVLRWARQYDGSLASLAKRTHPNRPQILSPHQQGRFIRDPILRRQAEKRAVNYKELATRIRSQTDLSFSDRTVRRYGQRNFNYHERRTKRQEPREGNALPSLATRANVSMV
jgi:transposase